MSGPAGPGAREQSDALHARARAMVRAFERGAPGPEPFDRLAADLARFQAMHVPGYGRLCAARGVRPAAIATASEAPAVPAEAFKLGEVFALDPAEAAVCLRTSGTTFGARGTHRMRDGATYDAAALAFGRAMLARGLPLPAPVLVLGPSPDEARDSSLARMYGLFAQALGDGGAAAGGAFFVQGGAMDVAALRARVRALDPAAPAIVLSTSFALVHLLDALHADAAGVRLALPPGSRVVQTGGYKGRSREVAEDVLRRDVARAFAVDERAVFSEYGMTELSSQFWEATAVDPSAERSVFLEPPWARVVPVHPETLDPVAAGEAGIARIEDLANVDSAFAVLTQDRVRRRGPGFELLGRQAGAPPRGCSLALEEMLGARGEAP